MQKKKISKKLLLKVARLAKTHDNSMHVISREDQWVLKRDGAKRVSGIYATKNQAVDAAKDQVRSGKISYALVHDMNGEIAQKIG